METQILTMREYGEFLGTRALGERVRHRLLEILKVSQERVVLDFSGVHGITQSFADELFRKLREEATAHDAARVAASHMTDDVRAVLRYAVSKPEQSTR